MTNDKDGAALLREALGEDRKWLADDIWLSIPAYMRKSINKAHFTALKSHGQALNRYGQHDHGCTLAMRLGDPCSCGWANAAAAIRALPIPEAPASVEPVADDVRRLVIAAREAWEVMGDCSADASYSANLDKALEAFSSRVLYENEPGTIGSHFGNGGGLDPVETDETFRFAQGIVALANSLQGRPAFDSEIVSVKLIRAVAMVVNGEAFRRMGLPPSPAFGGGDSREAREVIAYSIIEGSAGIRAAEHAKDFQTVNWSDALRSADAVIATLAALSHDQRGGSGE